MRFKSLHVTHVRKGTPDAVLAPFAMGARIGAGALYLDSCQRTLWVHEGPRELGEEVTGVDQLAGIEAYRFLLRVATGLESEVVGETDIFGQLKAAWKSCVDLDPGLAFWLQKIFEDTKEIRAEHLEHLGGLTYGSLVRKHFEGRLKGVTLLVGAGALGAAVAPYLVGSDTDQLLILNRDLEKAQNLLREVLALHPLARVRLVFPDEESEAWSRANRAVICIPTDAVADVNRLAAFRRFGTQNRELLHLGCARPEAGAWTELERAAFLDDIFRLQKSQGETRSVRVATAERACDARAKLRSLGANVSIAHGWEDLALFA